MKMMFAFALIAVIFSGCIFAPLTIKEVKMDTYVGKEVTVSGIVQGTIKIGDLSGYTIKDDSDTISVSSANLPKEGDRKIVTGTLRKNILFGYYLEE